jgi:hypothetical protein
MPESQIQIYRLSKGVYPHHERTTNPDIQIEYRLYPHHESSVPDPIFLLDPDPSFFSTITTTNDSNKTFFYI